MTLGDIFTQDSGASPHATDSNASAIPPCGRLRGAQQEALGAGHGFGNRKSVIAEIGAGITRSTGCNAAIPYRIVDVISGNPAPPTLLMRCHGLGRFITRPSGWALLSLSLLAFGALPELVEVGVVGIKIRVSLCGVFPVRDP